MPQTALAQVERADPNVPSYQGDAYKAMVAEMQVNRDVVQGTSHLRNLGRLYLPQATKERSEDYRTRKNRSVLFNGLSLTIDGLAGMVFRVEPSLGDDVNAQIAEHWENIDNCGRHGTVFLKDVFKDSLNAGHAGIFVDAPIVDGQLSQADERILGVRPYWRHVLKEDILNWRLEVMAGEMVLTQVTLREIVMEPAGGFGEKEVTRFRVYRLGTSEDNQPTVFWEVWTSPGDGKPPVKGETGTLARQDRIPLAINYTEMLGPMLSRPPLLDLAWTNVTHWQVKSDHLHALHKASVPILFGAGIPLGADEVLEVGVNAVVASGETGASLSYVEHSGSSINATREELKDLKMELASQGLAMLQVETRSAETAEAKRIDKAEQDSKLSSAARSLQDAAEQALGFHAKYMGLEGGSITINREFEDMSLGPDQVRLYLEMQKNGQMTLETMWSILQDRGGLPPDFDMTEEMRKLEAEAEARRQTALQIAGGGNGEGEEEDDDNAES